MSNGWKWIGAAVVAFVLGGAISIAGPKGTGALLSLPLIWFSLLAGTVGAIRIGVEDVVDKLDSILVEIWKRQGRQS